MCSSTWELHQWLAIDDKSSQNQFFSIFHLNDTFFLYWSSKVYFVYMTGLCWCSTSVVGPLEIQLYRGFSYASSKQFLLTVNLNNQVLPKHTNTYTKKRSIPQKLTKKVWQGVSPHHAINLFSWPCKLIIIQCLVGNNHKEGPPNDSLIL